MIDMLLQDVQNYCATFWSVTDPETGTKSIPRSSFLLYGQDIKFYTDTHTNLEHANNPFTPGDRVIKPDDDNPIYGKKESRER
ncbi:hypothetical protein JCM18750_01910 [Halostagnicola bangensis]